MAWVLGTKARPPQAAPPQASPHHPYWGRDFWIPYLSFGVHGAHGPCGPFPSYRTNSLFPLSEAGCIFWFQPYPTCYHAAVRTQGELGHLLHFWLCEFGHGYSTSLAFHPLSGKLSKQEHTLHWMPEAGSENIQVRVVDSNLHCPSFLSDGHSVFPPISPSLSIREYSASAKQAS